MKKQLARGGWSPAWSLSLAVALAALAGPLGCAKVQPTNGGAGRGTGGVGGGRGGVGSGGRSSITWVAECTSCPDFKTAPIFDTGVPANAADSFVGNPPTSGGPWITEPEEGTMFPKDWLRPRIRFSGANGQLVRITLSAANQSDVLTAYTTSDRWAIPKDVWIGLRNHQVQDLVTVTVWVKGGGASQTHFKTAPVTAGGNLIFWAAKPSEVDKNLEVDCPKGANNQPLPSCYAADSELRFFSVGDETTISALTIPQIVQQSKDNNNKSSPVRCIGCHAGTPDGDFVAFNDAWPWRGVMAGVTKTNVGMPPPYLTQGGVDDLQQPALGVMAFSKGHWNDSERIVITSDSWTPTNRMQGMAWYDAPHNPRPELVWFDLASPPVPRTGGNVQGDPANPDLVFPIVGTNMGIIGRSPDTRGAATPNWSHSGELIAYSSTDSAVDGHLDNIPTPNPNPFNWSHNMGHSDVWVVPYGNKLGGTARAVRGADTTTFEEYFPSFSPDDKLIAFNRVPVSESMYANPKSEIAVIQTADDPNIMPRATVLSANRPPACTQKVSPGVNNHWVKWAPTFGPGTEGMIYWVVFSSNRADIPPVASKFGAKRQISISQLYIAPVVIGESGVVPYPAIYLWNQPTDTVNTTPAWEVFQLPPIP